MLPLEVTTNLGGSMKNLEIFVKIALDFFLLQWTYYYSMFWHIKYITRGKEGEEEKVLFSIQSKLTQLTKFQKSHTWVCGFSIPMTTSD